MGRRHRVYSELRKLAQSKLQNEPAGNTLDATALVHEAYLRLVGNEEDHAWNGRGHFYAAAAEAMRRILVESARRKRRVKHGGEYKRLPLTSLDLADRDSPDVVIALQDGLDLLAQEEPDAARYFAQSKPADKCHLTDRSTFRGFRAIVWGHSNCQFLP